ncbi:MAG: TadE/TadG family type IV pilus assembly protein [Candidatus Angelobacter sp.]
MAILNTRLKTDSGQSLVETALIVPLLLLITFNAVNFGYFFFVALHLTSAPRQGVEYSIQGFASPRQLDLPSPGPSATNTSVSWLTYQDMVGLNSSSNAEVQVCTKTLGLAAPGQAQCQQFPAGATFPAAGADPEPTSFVLHRVDVRYTISPLIPAGLFGLTLTPSLTFHRQASMRALD